MNADGLVASDDRIDEVLDAMPPLGSGIANVVRWATENAVPLQTPPWEDAFCGSKTPAVYAGMVDTSNYDESKRADVMEEHARWLVDHLAIRTDGDDEDTPPTTTFPMSNFIIVAMDVFDHDDPRANFFHYDFKETRRKMTACVKPFSLDDVERMSKRRSSPLYGIRPAAVTGFAEELQNVICEYLIAEDEERETVIDEIQASNLKGDIHNDDASG